MSEQKRSLAKACICVGIYIIVILTFIPIVYGIIDDRSMMEFVSGQYLGKPDAHTIFSGYWYSLGLTGLYTLIPNVDWYAVSYLGIQSLCMILILYRVWNLQVPSKKKLLYVGCTVLAYVAFGLQAFTQLSFTTTAAILGVFVIFWYATTEKMSFGDWLLIGICCFLTEQIRSDVFFMILPICGVLWIFRLSEDDGRLKWNLMIPAAVVIVFGLSLVGHQIGYGSDQWKAYTEYNEMRSAIYDYDDYSFLTYEEGEDFYRTIGIEKKSRARTLLNYNYTADDEIDADFFGAYIHAYKEYFEIGSDVIQNVKVSVKEYIKGVLNNRFHLSHIGCLIWYLTVVIICVLKKDWKLLGKTVLMVGVQILLWLYLLYEGRVPERVIYSMNLMMIMTAILFFRDIKNYIAIPKKMKNLGIAAAIVGMMASAVLQICHIRQENMDMSSQNEAVEELKLYCMQHLDNFYFNDVTSLAFTTYNVHLWQSEPYKMNYMSLGDWMSFSPLWEEKLEQQCITSVKEALYQQENVFLICSFDKGVEYLVKLYDGVECTEVDKVAGFRIYKLDLKK